MWFESSNHWIENDSNNNEKLRPERTKVEKRDVSKLITNITQWELDNFKKGIKSKFIGNDIDELKNTLIDLSSIAYERWYDSWEKIELKDWKTFTVADIKVQRNSIRESRKFD